MILYIEDCPLQGMIYKNMIKYHLNQDLVIHASEFNIDLLKHFNFKLAIIDWCNDSPNHNPLEIKRILEANNIVAKTTSADFNDNICIAKSNLILETLNLYKNLLIKK